MVISTILVGTVGPPAGRLVLPLRPLRSDDGKYRPLDKFSKDLRIVGLPPKTELLGIG